MKISNIKTSLVNLPLERPITTAIHQIKSVGCVLLDIETDQGLVGQSYVFTINATRLAAFNEMIKGFAHIVIGEDPHYVERIWQRTWQEINPTGHKGVTISALSAIDTACWDLIGKYSEKPLHHVFGACRDEISTYASGGLWLSQSIDELQIEAADYLAAGFKAMKIRLGSDSALDDVQRVRAVREVIGPEIELMADLNQAHSPKQAIRLARLLEEFSLAWLEEPVSANDLIGQARVTAAIDTPVASGETEYTLLGMEAMIRQKACDILMPDLQRIGGLSEMRKVAHLAGAHHMPISTHIFTEHSLSIAGSCHNCISVEHMPWYAPLFNEKLAIENGKIMIPKRHGTGFTFSESARKKFKI